jgi:hypothetical protein
MKSFILVLNLKAWARAAKKSEQSILVHDFARLLRPLQHKSLHLLVYEEAPRCLLVFLVNASPSSSAVI